MIVCLPVKKVAVAAHVDAKLGARGAHLELRAARAAVDRGLLILGMDVRLHAGAPSTPSVRDRCSAVVVALGLGATPRPVPKPCPRPGRSGRASDRGSHARTSRARPG